MIARRTASGFELIITPAEIEARQERAARFEALAAETIQQARDYLARQDQARPRFRVLLNPNTAKNSKTAEIAGVPGVHALRAHTQQAGTFSISENITLRKLK